MARTSALGRLSCNCFSDGIQGKLTRIARAFFALRLFVDPNSGLADSSYTNLALMANRYWSQESQSRPSPEYSHLVRRAGQGCHLLPAGGVNPGWHCPAPARICGKNAKQARTDNQANAILERSCRGVRRGGERLCHSPRCLTQAPLHLQLYGLFTTTFVAGLLTSS